MNKESNNPSKRPFISQRKEELNTSNFLTIPIADYRYVNETDFQSNALKLPISENVDMNNKKIINCSEGENDNDVCTMKNLRSQVVDLRMNNHRITNLADGISTNDAVNLKQLRQTETTVVTSLTSSLQNQKLFYYKYGRITFNRHGVCVIYKAPADTVAVGTLLVSNGSNEQARETVISLGGTGPNLRDLNHFINHKTYLYSQEPIITKGEYTLFIPPINEMPVFINKTYCFYYWKHNLISNQNCPGFKDSMTEEEINNLIRT